MTCYVASITVAKRIVFSLVLKQRGSQAPAPGQGAGSTAGRLEEKVGMKNDSVISYKNEFQ